ncbi:unnamed protein product [Peronospora farinosa]|uniref:Choline transporter-like protein n=1 Tax=Peronospora farinosa TaxID=134698 RepID=A0AAV0TP83_9STRA|nr:unnamed protein product [Peronospora farinosa]
MVLLAEALIWATLITITVLNIVTAVFFAKKARNSDSDLSGRHFVGAEVIFSYHVPPGIHPAILVELGMSTCTTDNCNLSTRPARLSPFYAACSSSTSGSRVKSNIISVTTAGTFAVWKNAAITPFVTMEAWLRALTLNLGSIIFGSLSVAIL